jgi:hypothetical protein
MINTLYIKFILLSKLLFLFYPGYYFDNKPKVAIHYFYNRFFKEKNMILFYIDIVLYYLVNLSFICLLYLIIIRNSAAFNLYDSQLAQINDFYSLIGSLIIFVIYLYNYFNSDKLFENKQLNLFTILYWVFWITLFLLPFTFFIFSYLFEGVILFKSIIYCASQNPTGNGLAVTNNPIDLDNQQVNNNNQGNITPTSRTTNIQNNLNEQDPNVAEVVPTQAINNAQQNLNRQNLPTNVQTHTNLPQYRA